MLMTMTVLDVFEVSGNENDTSKNGNTMTYFFRETGF